MRRFDTKHQNNVWRLLLCVITCVPVIGAHAFCQAQTLIGEAERLDTSISQPGRPDYWGAVSNDGLTFYFSTDAGEGGRIDIYASTRDSIAESWQDPVRLDGPVNSASGGKYFALYVIVSPSGSLASILNVNSVLS